MSRLCIVFLLLVNSVLLLQAEDLPLGFITEIDGRNITASFNAAHDILPDDMVAIYGPGKVVKHPLTKQIETEHRKLVAKAQVTKSDAKTLRAKVVFVEEGVTLANGFDVVPMPGEASPDSAPVLTDEIAAVAVSGQDTVVISLPIKDPEGAAIGVEWSLKGESGRVGALSSQSTGVAEITWTAPGFESNGSILATASDELSQQLAVEIPFSVSAVGDDYRKRSLKPYASFGGSSGTSFSRVSQSDAGFYWATSADGRSILQVTDGWSRATPLEVADDANLRQPIALQQFGRELFVLDGGARAVLLLAAGGQLQRSIGGLQGPTDLAVGKDGSVYVADQRSGGVQVFENDGAFRVCLGRAGEGVDSFKGLTRICLDKDDNCYALDAEQRMILRFNKFHRRLDTWNIQGDPQNKIIDIKAHALGLLILQADGQVLIHTEQGLSGTALPSPAGTGLIERIGEPSSLVVDRSGKIYVTYPKDKLLVRYSKSGKLAGIRGPALWAYKQVVSDARGWRYGLDERSGFIYAHDNEGWRLYKFGGSERNGGPFERPSFMAVAFDGSALVVADERRYAIERFNLQDMGKSKITFGQRGKNNGQFEDIACLCMDDSGFTYVADERNHRVSVFNTEGNFMYQFGSYERGRTASEIVRPAFIAVNGAGTVCYIYDSKKYEIQKFELNLADGRAQHVTNAGGRGKAMGQVSKPVGLACDRFGLLYLLDSGRRDLQALDFRGNNLVGINALPLSEYGMSSVDTLALNPDGLPCIGARGAFMAFRWEK